MGGKEGRGGLGFMLCPSFVLGGDANTGSAGYVCLETELMGWESDFHAAMLAAFAFAALLWFKLSAGSGQPWTRDGGIPQGCPLSMMFIVALYLPWYNY